MNIHLQSWTYIKEELKRVILLKVAGFKKEEADGMDLTNVKDGDFQKMVREKLLGAITDNVTRQRVVPVNEVRELIPKSEYVAQLRTGEAIVKLPF